MLFTANNSHWMINTILYNTYNTRPGNEGAHSTVLPREPTQRCNGDILMRWTTNLASISKSKSTSKQQDDAPRHTSVDSWPIQQGNRRTHSTTTIYLHTPTALQCLTSQPSRVYPLTPTVAIWVQL